MAKTVIYRDAAGEWRWRTTARNGRIVAASSEGFNRRGGARNNLRLTAEALSNGEVHEEDPPPTNNL